jgi:hypothetical protein
MMTGVLVPLVLHEQSVLDGVDEVGDAVPAVRRAPDQMGAATRIEFLTVPIGFEAFDDLGDLVGTGRHDGVVAGFGEVLIGPVQRLGEGELAVDHHRLLVRQIERRGNRLGYVDVGENHRGYLGAGHLDFRSSGHCTPSATTARSPLRASPQR